MIRPTIQIGHPLLTAANQPITDFASDSVYKTIQDLTDTMYEAGLIGIAAPQIGENVQIFITEPRQTSTRPADQADEFRIYSNPKIIKYSSKEIILYEGCGSILNGQLFGPVQRPALVTIEACDQTGKKFQFTADGILGRVLQHELDHLQGALFTEKVTEYKNLMHVDYYKERIKNSPQHIKDPTITVKEFRYL